jgi:HD superfamily phosphohydrolase
VSGPTDADKIDYLRRDSHYTGVNQGHFDYEYFLDQVIGIELGGESWLGFRANAIWAVEGLILARYQMRRTVYGHRNRVVTDLMLQRGLETALGSVLPASLLKRPSEADFLRWFEQYIAYDDWRVFEECLSDRDRPGRIFRRLRDHDLLKISVFLDSDEFRDRLGVVHARKLLSRETLELEGDFSMRIATVLGLGPDELIAHVIDEKHVLATPDPREDQDINFEISEGRIEPFIGRSEVFSAQPTSRFPQLAVYASQGRKYDQGLARQVESAVIDQLKAELEDRR